MKLHTCHPIAAFLLQRSCYRRVSIISLWEWGDSDSRLGLSLRKYRACPAATDAEPWARVVEARIACWSNHLVGSRATTLRYRPDENRSQGTVAGRSMKKADVLDIVEELANDEDVGVDKLIYTLAFRREVDKGLAAADRGDEVSIEEFEQQSEQWLV